MPPDSRFGISFWTAVIVLTVGSVGCLGYAELQLRDSDRRPLHQREDVRSTKLRSATTFERTR